MQTSGICCLSWTCWRNLSLILTWFSCWDVWPRMSFDAKEGASLVSFLSLTPICHVLVRLTLIFFFFFFFSFSSPIVFTQKIFSKTSLPRNRGEGGGEKVGTFLWRHSSAWKLCESMSIKPLLRETSPKVLFSRKDLNINDVCVWNANSGGIHYALSNHLKATAHTRLPGTAMTTFWVV